MRTHSLSWSLVMLFLLLPALALAPACGGDEEPDPADESSSEGSGEESGEPEKPDEDAPPERVVVEASPFETRAKEALAAAEGAETRLESLTAKQRARVALSEAMMAGVSPEDEKRILPMLETLTEEILDAGTPLAGVVFQHELKSGQTLWALCNPGKTFEKKGARVEPGFACWINGVANPTRLRAGQNLLVPVGEFKLVVEKSNYRLLVFYGGCFLKMYPVGLGKQDRTPEGEFVIETKQEKPAWTSPNNDVIPYGDPRNPLGTRWMGFKNQRKAHGYGIHGTKEPETIGQDSSNGCIRMHDRDVKELFSWVPRKTKVLIRR